MNCIELKLLENGFELDRANNWSKFSDNHEYYVEKLPSGRFNFSYCFHALDEQDNTNFEESFSKEETLNSCDLNWFAQFE